MHFAVYMACYFLVFLATYIILKNEVPNGEYVFDLVKFMILDAKVKSSTYAFSV